MAARETGFGAVEQYLHAGKLLALELLVRILENPHHHWSALRPEVSVPYVFSFSATLNASIALGSMSRTAEETLQPHMRQRLSRIQRP